MTYEHRLDRLTNQLTDRYETKKTYVSEIGDYCINMYLNNTFAIVNYTEIFDAYALLVFEKHKPVYSSEYNLTYEQLINHLDQYFPHKKVQQMEMEID